MTASEHLAVAIGLLDRYANANDAQERGRLLAHSQMHSVLARRPELATVLPRIIAHPKAALLIGGIR